MTKRKRYGGELIVLACKCHASRDHVAGGFRIEAESFLCGQRHKQGDGLTVEEERYARLVEAEWDRAEAEYLEQDGIW